MTEQEILDKIRDMGTYVPQEDEPPALSSVWKNKEGIIARVHKIFRPTHVALVHGYRTKIQMVTTDGQVLLEFLADFYDEWERM